MPRATLLALVLASALLAGCDSKPPIASRSAEAAGQRLAQKATKACERAQQEIQDLEAVEGDQLSPAKVSGVYEDLVRELQSYTAPPEQAAAYRQLVQALDAITRLQSQKNVAIYQGQADRYRKIKVQLRQQAESARQAARALGVRACA